MEEWKEYKLEDICSDIFAGGDAKKLKTTQEKNSINRIPVYANSVDKDGLYGYCQTPIVLKPAVTVAARGSGTGFVAYRKEPFVPIVRLITLITKNNVDIQFLYYNLKNRNLKGDGSAIPQITIPMIKKEIVSIPNIHIQRKISGILSSLDDKIELNRRINENLEQQAQALFKSWFVDFEPFKDGLFVDSELGKIPEGWQVGTFKDIIHSTLSGDWGKECKQGNHIQKVFCIRGADIPNIKRGDKGNMPTRFIIEKNFQSKALMDGDMVIEVSGGSPTQATGRACRISRGLLDKYNHSIVCTNFCRAIKPLSQYSSFLYYMWEMFYNQGIMFSYENGTTGIKNLDINGLIQKEPIIIPPVEIALEFEKITQIYYEKIQSNGVESEMLSLLRDTLLPRLMSGKLEIKDNSYD